MQGNKFYMNSGSLGFSVLVFTGLAFLAIMLFYFRRINKGCGSAELGGPKATRVFSGLFLLLLWIVYIFLSTLEAYEVLRPGF